MGWALVLGRRTSDSNSELPAPSAWATTGMINASGGVESLGTGVMGVTILTEMGIVVAPPFNAVLLAPGLVAVAAGSSVPIGRAPVSVTTSVVTRPSAGDVPAEGARRTHGWAAVTTNGVPGVADTVICWTGVPPDPISSELASSRSF